MKKPKFACFDIFDTVLFRAVLAPSDVFRLVYLDLVELEVLKPIEVDEDAFVAARRSAEDAAKIGVPECTLEQIWSHLALHLGKDCASVGMEAEKRAECQVLYPNAEIVETVRQNRAVGRTIVFISDMYLSGAFLKGVLMDLNIWKDGDEIFVSSDEGARKHTGTLYKKVRKELGGSARNYHMTGDNRRSDVLRARLAGWRARHYRGGKINEYERSLSASLVTNRLQKSVLVGGIRKYRNGVAEEQLPRFTTDFMGLVSFFWALWAIPKS